MIISTFTATILAENNIQNANTEVAMQKNKCVKEKVNTGHILRHSRLRVQTTDIERSDVATSQICVTRKILILY